VAAGPRGLNRFFRQELRAWIGAAFGFCRSGCLSLWIGTAVGLRTGLSGTHEPAAVMGSLEARKCVRGFCSVAVDALSDCLQPIERRSAEYAGAMRLRRGVWIFGSGFARGRGLALVQARRRAFGGCLGTERR